jgi:thioredoxin reductase/NAD-dependent dihydropyrimidine dehydrogenase PreA subunit
MVSLVSIALVAAVAVTSVLLATWIRRPRARVAPVRLPLVHSINDDRCVGCDACIDVCPTDVLELIDNKSRVARFDDCIGCEQCAMVCPTAALVMHPEGSTPPPVRAAALDDYHQAAPGLYLVGEAAGRPLVKNSSNLGRAVIEHMIGEGLRARRGGADEVDVVIVGSGPAGLSAALSCAARGLSYVVLEKDASIASTIANYPKGKHVMAEPYDVRCLGFLPVWDTTKEELLSTWQQLLRRRGVAVRTRHTVSAIERDAIGFVVRAQSGDTTRSFRAQRVVLGIGTRGTPRKLGVPGESLPKVSPLLRDAAAHRGQAVVVVGGGDSAVEAALALGDEAAHVVLSYRGKSLSRCKARNRQALDRAVEEGRVHVLYGSKVTEIREASLLVECGDERVELPNDHVFVCIGGDPPTRWLESLGVRFVDEPHQTRRRASDELVESLVGPVEAVSADRSGPLAQFAAAGVVLALALAASGCLGDLVPYSPPSGPAAPAPQSASSADAGPSSDGGAPVDGAGTAAFQPDIMADLTRLGCPSCHNGGPPMKLIPAPASATDWMANYAAVEARAMNAAQSLLLTKTLAGSGVTHAGGSPFASTSDPTYARWLAWIDAGAPK